jgi:transposase
MLKTQVSRFDRRIMAWHRSNEMSKRAARRWTRIGDRLASVVDPKAFQSGRDFSTWIGLVPKQNSSGGKDKLCSISKQDLRSLFTASAPAVVRYAKIQHPAAAVAHQITGTATPR